jgi:hypothetical protein
MPVSWVDLNPRDFSATNFTVFFQIIDNDKPPTIEFRSAVISENGMMPVNHKEWGHSCPHKEFIRMTRTQTWWLRICVASLVLLMQGPAMLTQEVAWVGMLVSYTRDRGLARGVVETFDGNHPCAMCAKASKMRENEGEKEPAERNPGTKRLLLAWAEMILPHGLRLKNPVAVDCSVEKPRGLLLVCGRGRIAPGTPPPRFAFS